jgi:hypothetical protein
MSVWSTKVSLLYSDLPKARIWSLYVSSSGYFQNQFLLSHGSHCFKSTTPNVYVLWSIFPNHQPKRTCLAGEYPVHLLSRPPWNEDWVGTYALEPIFPNPIQPFHMVVVHSKSNYPLSYVWPSTFPKMETFQPHVWPCLLYLLYLSTSP